MISTIHPFNRMSHNSGSNHIQINICQKANAADATILAADQQRYPLMCMNMKKLTIIFVFGATIFITVVSESQDIPSSARSRAAISRVKPKLQKEFSLAGFNWGTPIFIRILKKTKELEIWLKDRKNFRLFKTYKVYLWLALFRSENQTR